MANQASSRALKDFLGEAEEIIEKLSMDLIVLGNSAESGETEPDLLNSIFRGAHSVKGLAGMFGFVDISELSHHMESLLDRLRLGHVPLDGILVETLFEALEILTRLVHGKADADDFSLDLAPIIQRMEGVLGHGSGKKPDLLAGLNIDAGILNVLTEYEEHRLLENLKKERHLLRVKVSFSLGSFDLELAELSEILKKKGEIISTLPSAGDQPDRIGFQLLFGTNSALEEVREQLGEGVAVELLTTGGGKPLPLAKMAPAEGRSEPAEGGEASLRSISRTVRVDIEKLDSLMNIVGELVLSKGAIIALCERLKVEGDADLAADLQKTTRILERRLDELQKGVMEVRMVPVSQLFEKMVRIVRRVANDHGKKVGLDMRGGDTELDKLIIEDLSDPLMHIIRNSIDHGIEHPEERLAGGKPEQGLICLHAAQKGNHVVIEVKDDGRGIDPEKVRRKAVAQGLIAEGMELSRDDVFNLILSPGFSTRDQVTDLSGRGVGMDVVKTNITALSGMVEMDSRVGQGTTMTITLPITLAIIKALIIQVCGRTYAIPINSVLETLMIEPSAIQTVERREVMELRESTLPLLRLSRIFDLPEEGPAVRGARPFVVVVGLADKKMGVVVDELLGQQDVVIKSLGSTLCFVRGIAGAADLGNQKTILVLDVGGLLSEVLRGESAAFYV